VAFGRSSVKNTAESVPFGVIVSIAGGATSTRHARPGTRCGSGRQRLVTVGVLVEVVGLAASGTGEVTRAPLLGGVSSWRGGAHAESNVTSPTVHAACRPVYELVGKAVRRATAAGSIIGFPATITIL
jgi:hypothetical protein